MTKEMGVSVEYAQGYSTEKKNKISDDTFVKEAVEKAKNAEVAVLFIGLTDEFETEGNDRKHLGIPPLHNRLVEEVLKVNKNVVVVLSGGSSVEMPWADEVPAILNEFLTGQAAGSAVCDILFGDVNPRVSFRRHIPSLLRTIQVLTTSPALLFRLSTERVFM